MRSEVITITPKMAAELLNSNTKNRAISIKRVRKYAEDMKSGRWQLTHQGISIFEDGTLADGQHRLRAVCIANVAVPMLVTYDLPNGTSMIDRINPRSVANILQLEGIPDNLANNETVACVNFLFGNSLGEKKNSETKIAEFVMDKADLLSQAIAVCKGGKKSGAQMTRRAACTAAAFCALYNGVSPLYLDRFFKVVNSGFAEGNYESAAVVFRNVMLNMSGKRSYGAEANSYIFVSCTRAIRDFINCTPRRKAYTSDEPIYWESVKAYIIEYYND